MAKPLENPINAEDVRAALNDGKTGFFAEVDANGNIIPYGIIVNDVSDLSIKLPNNEIATINGKKNIFVKGDGQLPVNELKWNGTDVIVINAEKYEELKSNENPQFIALSQNADNTILIVQQSAYDAGLRSIQNIEALPGTDNISFGALSIFPQLAPGSQIAYLARIFASDGVHEGVYLSSGDYITLLNSTITASRNSGWTDV